MRVVDRDTGRLDLVLFVNGLPVVLVENKSPKLEDPGRTGFDDVAYYTDIIPEFVKYPIPFAICARQLEYGATWNPSVNAFYTWKVDGQAHGLERLAETPVEVIRRTIDLNLTSAILVARAAVRAMSTAYGGSGGVLVGTNSTADHVGNPLLLRGHLSS